MTLPPDSVIIAMLVLYALFLAIAVPIGLRRAAEQTDRDEEAARRLWDRMADNERAAHARDQADADRRRRTPSTDQEK